MTKEDFAQHINNSDPELLNFLTGLTSKEWKDPDLCIVDQNPDGTVCYWWPNGNGDGVPKGVVMQAEGCTS